MNPLKLLPKPVHPQETEEEIFDNFKRVFLKFDEDNGTGRDVILKDNFSEYSFSIKQLVLLENINPDTSFEINHIIVKGSRQSLNPVKHVFFWCFNEKPDMTTLDLRNPLFKFEESVIERDIEGHLDVTLPEINPPFFLGHVFVDRYSFIGGCHLLQPINGRYIVVWFADYWETRRSNEEATIQKLLFFGPSDKPRPLHGQIYVPFSLYPSYMV